MFHKISKFKFPPTVPELIFRFLIQPKLIDNVHLFTDTDPQIQHNKLDFPLTHQTLNTNDWLHLTNQQVHAQKLILEKTTPKSASKKKREHKDEPV